MPRSQAADTKFFFRAMKGGPDHGVLTAHAPGGWRISAGVRTERKGVEIVTSVSGDRARDSLFALGDFLVSAQDLPSGGAAQTLILNDGGADVRAFVATEVHYSHGQKWNPSPDQPAEVGYYPDGTVKWQRRWLQGNVQASGDSPSFESFWSNGAPQCVEYGRANREDSEKHRDRTKGPAYTEFFPNGKPALCMFAEKGSKVGGLLFFSEDGNRRTPTSQELRRAEADISASVLTAQLQHDDFLGRHESCLKAAPDLMGGVVAVERTKTKTARPGSRVEAVALPRPGILGRVGDWMSENLIPKERGPRKKC